MLRTLTNALYTLNFNAKRYVVMLINKSTGKEALINKIQGLNQELTELKAINSLNTNDNIRLKHCLREILLHQKEMLNNKHIPWYSALTSETFALLVASVAILGVNKTRRLSKKAPPEAKQKARDVLNRVILIYKDRLTKKQAEATVYKLRGKSLINHNRCSYKG